jgi:hypothetical protein
MTWTQTDRLLRRFEKSLFFSKKITLRFFKKQRWQKMLNKQANVNHKSTKKLLNPSIQTFTHIQTLYCIIYLWRILRQLSTFWAKTATCVPGFVAIIKKIPSCNFFGTAHRTLGPAGLRIENKNEGTSPSSRGSYKWMSTKLAVPFSTHYSNVTWV